MKTIDASGVYMFRASAATAGNQVRVNSELLCCQFG